MNLEPDMSELQETKSPMEKNGATKAEKKSRRKDQDQPLVLIMAGGKGERFWPRSRVTHPKQLQKVYSDKTLLEETWERARLITDEKYIFIGCNAELKKAILKTHKRIKKSAFVVEPEGRNTAPIIALAALELEDRYPGRVHIILSADHFIAPPEEFQKTIVTAMAAAREGNLVTLGVRPSRPEVGYGYIQAGALTSSGYHQIDSFREKPDAASAREYLNAGNYYWNAGIFIWQGSTIVQEFRQHAPDILEPIQKNYASFKKLSAAFPDVPSRPVDIAIMEKSQKVAMVPASFTWDDVGSWLSLERICDRDAHGNVVVTRRKKPPQTVALDAANNVLVADRKLIALLGVRDTILVEEDDVIFLASRERIDDIKSLLGQMKENPTLQKFLQ